MATRKIKDAKDLSTEELIYFKGHAKATFMSDGRNVEDAIHQIGTGGGGGGITTETDPIFSASPAASITEAKKEEWDNKVDEESLLWTQAEGESGVRLKGTNGTATGNLAISAGDDKTASDGTAFASVASGDHAVAFGYGNTCAGRTTLAQGLYNIVNGKDAVAFGQRNTVNGDQAFAAGQQNEVAARLGVVIGYKNKATNTDSIAIGYQNTSSGSASVAMGDTCEANGTSSTAMGYKTKATGAYSSTFGENTQATNTGEVAMGMFNKSTTSTDDSEQTLFSFGIGTSDTDRVNALEIKRNGDVYIGDKLLSDGGVQFANTELKIAEVNGFQDDSGTTYALPNSSVNNTNEANLTIAIADANFVIGEGMVDSDDNQFALPTNNVGLADNHVLATKQDVANNKNLIYKANSATSGTLNLEVNVCHHFPNPLNGTFTIQQPANYSNNNAALVESRIVFTTGTTVPSIVFRFTAATRWANGVAPTFEANTTYEISLFFPADTNTKGPLGVCVGFK